VDLVGVSSGDQRQSVYCVFADASQTRSLADAAVIFQMFEDIERLFGFEA
jgi:hypothetical protein